MESPAEDNQSPKLDVFKHTAGKPTRGTEMGEIIARRGGIPVAATLTGLQVHDQRDPWFQKERRAIGEALGYVHFEAGVADFIGRIKINDVLKMDEQQAMEHLLLHLPPELLGDEGNAQRGFIAYEIKHGVEKLRAFVASQRQQAQQPGEAEKFSDENIAALEGQIKGLELTSACLRKVEVELGNIRTLLDQILKIDQTAQDGSSYKRHREPEEVDLAEFSEMAKTLSSGQLRAMKISLTDTIKILLGYYALRESHGLNLEPLAPDEKPQHRQDRPRKQSGCIVIYTPEEGADFARDMAPHTAQSIKTYVDDALKLRELSTLIDEEKNRRAKTQEAELRSGYEHAIDSLTGLERGRVPQDIRETSAKISAACKALLDTL